MPPSWWAESTSAPANLALLKAVLGAGRIALMGCIIFDLDGTLVDSEPACSRALLDLIPELSIDLIELTDRYRGWKLAEILVDLETRLALKLPAGIETAYRDRVAAIFETELRAMPEAEEALSTIEV